MIPSRCVRTASDVSNPSAQLAASTHLIVCRMKWDMLISLEEWPVADSFGCQPFYTAKGKTQAAAGLHRVRVKYRWAPAPQWLQPLRQDCCPKGERWQSCQPSGLLSGGSVALLPQRVWVSCRRCLELPMGMLVCPSRGAVVAHCQPSRA